MTVLVGLLYASKVAPNFGPMEMRDILESSRRNNVGHYRPFDHGRWLLLLEATHARSAEPKAPPAS
jgi:hypothetical protein